MAILAPSFVALLPLDLQAEYRAMAAEAHMTPDDLVMRVLQRTASDWRARRGGREREDQIALMLGEGAQLAVDRMAIVNAGKPEPHLVVLMTLTDACLDALADGQPATVDIIRQRVAALGVYGGASLRPILADLVNKGRLQRVATGVYARAADVPKED